MHLMPEDYHQLELSINYKRILNIFKSKLNNEWYALLRINPLGDHIGIDFALINRNYGLLCVNLVDFSDSHSLIEYTRLMFSVFQRNQEKLYERLIGHRMLKSGTQLKLTFNWIYLAPSIAREEMTYGDIDNNLKKFINDQYLFKDDISQMQRNPEIIEQLLQKSIYPSIKPESPLTEDEINIVIQRLAPEYIIPRFYEALSEEKPEYNTDSQNLDITGDELSVKVFRLDERQINLVNNLKRGNQLILACAGSGKSVLLISKAFKIGSIYPDKKMLITCYNRNLASYYNWQIDVAGFRERNVQCMAFFALCRYLLEKNRIPFNHFYEDDDKFDMMFETARKALHEGKIKDRYYGIFIDEVQIFKPEWYKFCFNLLETKKPENHVFVICGDKSQNVNDNIAKGIAPWQVKEKGFPNYDSNTIRIETNFRNSVPINQFINHFVTESKGYFNMLEIPVEQDHDLFLRGQAYRQGPAPVVIQANRANEKEKVVEIIEFLHNERRLPYSDIAVLFYNMQYRPKRYFPLYWIENQLLQADIPSSRLVNDQERWAVRYGDREGVSLLTIESALGLDFEAVILCGLLPMGVHKGTNKLSSILTAQGESRQEKNEDFFKCINQIYTGCTRARNHLFIVLTESHDTNLYSKIIWNAWERGAKSADI